MNLRKLLENVKKLLDEHPEAIDWLVGGVHGASGAPYIVSGPYEAEVGDKEEAETFGVEEGGKYVYFYLGN